jgi:hypothetical protein
MDVCEFGCRERRWFYSGTGSVRVAGFGQRFTVGSPKALHRKILIPSLKQRKRRSSKLPRRPASFPPFLAFTILYFTNGRN